MRKRNPLILLSGILVALSCVLAGPGHAETRVGGKLHGHFSWTRDNSPYVVTEDILIPAGSSLEINPGVTVRFKPDIRDESGTNSFDLELIVEGKLTVRGAEADTVYFTSDASRPTWFDWHGIVVNKATGSATITAAVIEYANVGLTCRDGSATVRDATFQFCSQQGVLAVNGTVTLDNVLANQVGNTGGTGIGAWADRGSTLNVTNSFFVGVQNGISFSRGSTGKLDRTVVTLSTGNGVMIRNSNPEVVHCTITANETGMAVSGGALPRIHHNNIFDNGTADLELSEYTREVVKLDVTNNWWGSPHLPVVEERVLDGIDNPAVKCFAIVEPFLTEAIQADGAGQAKP